MDCDDLRADATGLQALRDNPTWIFRLLGEWYELSVAAMYAIIDDDEPSKQHPKNPEIKYYTGPKYRSWADLIALWCDAQKLTISPEPILKLASAVRCREKNHRCHCGAKLCMTNHREKLGNCFTCNSPVFPPVGWMPVSKMIQLLDRVQRTKERIWLLVQASGVTPPRSRLRVDDNHADPAVFLDDTRYPITHTEAEYLRLLLDARGEYISADQYGIRSRDISLPAAVEELIDRSRGKGSILKSEAFRLA